MPVKAKSGYIIVLIVPVILLASAIYFLMFKDNNPAPAYQQERVLRFSYQLSNTSNNALTDVLFSTYIPIAETSNQSSGVIKTENDFELDGAGLSNRVAKFKVDLIPPYGHKNILFTSVIKTAEKPNRISIKDFERYLQAEKFIESNNAEIVELANKLRGETAQESAKNIFKWVSSRIKDSGYTSQDKGALYALKTKKGDCTEHMYLTIALARALEIPARGVGGFVYANNAVVNAADYHNWAELYVDGIWHVVDTQKKAFMERYQDYIAVRMISSPELSLLGNSHRFLVADDQIKVTMR